MALDGPTRPILHDEHAPGGARLRADAEGRAHRAVLIAQAAEPVGGVVGGEDAQASVGETDEQHGFGIGAGAGDVLERVEEGFGV